MQAFKTKAFARWARREGLRDDLLTFAIAEMEAGLIDAMLGGFLTPVQLAAAVKTGELVKLEV